MLKKLGLSITLLLLFFVVTNGRAYAATVSTFSDTITTSRPSAASPLSANNNASAQLSIYNNGSRFLASDSAKIMKTTTGADVLTGLTVASQSAALTTVYFTTTVSSGVNGADVLIANQTAMHTISFLNPQPIPSGGKIVITFPGAGITAASPSASTFSFNGLTSANASTNIKTNNATTCTWTVTAPSITCATSSSISAGTTITFLIGCTAATGAACTAQSPRLINPTKTAAAGTADTWSVTLKTQDASSVDLDSGTTKIGTIESVQVQASVDASFSFTIAGVATGAVNQGNATGCTTTDTNTAGIAPSAVLINLGSLPISTTVNISAQLITITTNASGGYSLTATSSGHLINSANGFEIADSTSPAFFPSTTPWFGFRPCGTDANTGSFGASSLNTARGSGAKYGWPTQTTALTLATNGAGPIITANNNGLITVEYAAAVDASVPSGNFATTVTYVATPTF